MAGRGGGVCVHIEPEHVQRARVVARQLLNGGRDLLARNAPRRPEIDQGQAPGGQGLRVEVRGGERGYMRGVGQ